MKRIVILAAAALMIGGISSLSIANESKPTAAVNDKAAVDSTPEATKQVVNPGHEKMPTAVNEKSTGMPSKEQPGSQPTVAQSNPTTTEKKEAPATTTSTPESKEKQMEHKASDVPANTNPTK
jgi:hypothetical protein